MRWILAVVGGVDRLNEGLPADRLPAVSIAVKALKR
jgi:hypothetical protein